MAKYNQLFDTIDKNITNGITHGVIHLTTPGRGENTTLIHDQHELVSFGSYSYLGLDRHAALQQGSILATEKYGTQFGYSRAYISIDLYQQLETLLAEIFKAQVLVAPSTTLAHQAVFPVLIEDTDIVLIDQYVHASVQTSIKMIRDRRIPVELIRHNRIDLLEERIKQLRSKHQKIWYMPDGVYSMYGDCAPLAQLYELMNRYEQLHLYVDDAHGMSWTGPRGAGYVLSQIQLHPQMVLVTSLNKAFAASGGAIVLPNKEWWRKVKTCGGTLIFSTPIPPPMLGAGVASATLHLSAELYRLQNDLHQNITHLARCLASFNIPELSTNRSPIFYIPTHLPKVSYNLVKRLMDCGFYLTPALFPAVSANKAGVRVCVNALHSPAQIESLAQALALHYPQALEQEQVALCALNNAFGTNYSLPTTAGHKSLAASGLLVERFESITQIDPQEWNTLLGQNGSFDWQGLAFLEQTFTHNEAAENNWQFFYLIIRDPSRKPILATFFTACLCKDDIFKPAAISEQLEEKRKTDPYYLTTYSLMMGSLLTEGQHLYIDKTSSYWQESLLLMFDTLNTLQLETQTQALYLRDFTQQEDPELQDLFLANGFIEIELPDYAHEYSQFGWPSIEAFLAPLSSKKRQQLRRDTFKYEPAYRVSIQQQVSQEELAHFYQLYLNVKRESFMINTFDLPFAAFQALNKHPNWEMIVLSLQKEQYAFGDAPKPIAVVFAYRHSDIYVPLLVGLDYRYKFSHKNYKQAVWQVLKRANELATRKLYFGITASTEKQRVGAIPIKKVAYVQIKDAFDMERLESHCATLSQGNPYD